MELNTKLSVVVAAIIISLLSPATANDEIIVSYITIKYVNSQSMSVFENFHIFQGGLERTILCSKQTFCLFDYYLVLNIVRLTTYLTSLSNCNYLSEGQVIICPVLFICIFQLEYVRELLCSILQPLLAYTSGKKTKVSTN